jgi:hypothetical protein
MSFGLLTTKWRCLRKKLEISLENSAKIIEACARMHNYVLDCKTEAGDFQEAMDEPEIHLLPGSPLGWG